MSRVEQDVNINSFPQGWLKRKAEVLKDLIRVKPAALAPVAVGEYRGNIIFMAGENKPPKVTLPFTMSASDAIRLRRAAKGKGIKFNVSKPDEKGQVTITLTGTQEKIGEAYQRMKFF